jgi:hypothetical protein
MRAVRFATRFGFAPDPALMEAASSDEVSDKANKRCRALVHPSSTRSWQMVQGPSAICGSTRSSVACLWTGGICMAQLTGGICNLPALDVGTVHSADPAIMKEASSDEVSDTSFLALHVAPRVVWLACRWVASAGVASI